MVLITCFAAASPSRSEIIAAYPKNADQYEKVFGHEPMGNELISVQEAVHAAMAPVSRMDSLAEYSKLAREGKGLLILVGHNGQGHFKFSSGESAKIEELDRIARDANRIGVFLTCNGACYTNSPAPRLKTTFKDAFTLAGEIENRFANLAMPGFSPVAPGFSPTTPGFSPAAPSVKKFSSVSLSVDQCAALFSKTSSTAAGVPVRYQEISKEIKRTIFHAEAAKVVTSVAKIIAGLSGPGFLYVTLDSRD
ncbi:hypothetical protein [Bradyrhizobium sp. NBAIM01]|uniref:hypothetical protein n=1 Tax=Bradyrhizobium sp. NBAIM01 TaxID=2793818 RepID=UPI001CD7029C|nr:hypothetical protein [Bradyrhizobium sp. NBAIM01]MCA1511099.1 hypothetical protein [Bradyrhizobium sp. NBAIM01]